MHGERPVGIGADLEPAAPVSAAPMLSPVARRLGDGYAPPWRYALDPKLAAHRNGLHASCVSAIGRRRL